MRPSAAATRPPLRRSKLAASIPGHAPSLRSLRTEVSLIESEPTRLQLLRDGLGPSANNQFVAGCGQATRSSDGVTEPLGVVL